MVRKNIIPYAAAEKLLKKVGAERVSDEAKIAFVDVLEEYADQMGQKAVRAAQHTKRKTIKASDVKLATK